MTKLDTQNEFIARHIGPRDADTAAMLELLGYDSVDALTGAVIPESIKGSSRTSSARVTTARTRRAQSCATCWKTRPGTPPTPPTSRRFPRDAWKRC